MRQKKYELFILWKLLFLWMHHGASTPTVRYLKRWLKTQYGLIKVSYKCQTNKHDVPCFKTFFLLIHNRLFGECGRMSIINSDSEVCEQEPPTIDPNILWHISERHEFCYFEKALNHIDHLKVAYILKHHELDGKYLRLVWILYWCQMAK